jgi:hypothetical protein
MLTPQENPKRIASAPSLGTRPFHGGLVGVYVVIASIAVDVLLLSAAFKASWSVSAVVVVSFALITTGILFSVLELLTLGRRSYDKSGS